MNASISSVESGSISVGDLWRQVRPFRWALLLGSVLGASVGLGISWQLNATYRAETTMLPSKSQDTSGGIGGLTNQVGGLAALAGINLQTNDSQIGALEYMKSNSLAMRFIDSHDIMPLLYPGRWQSSDRHWKPNWLGEVPTIKGAAQRLHADVLRISEDKRTGLVTVSVDWRDPDIASRWANEFVSMANEGLRARAISDAQAELSYLSNEIEKTQSLQVREALYRLVETQLKTLALAKVREDYAFRVIDPAVRPDRSDIVSPKRWLFAVIGMAIGAGLFVGLHSKFGSRNRAS